MRHHLRICAVRSPGDALDPLGELQQLELAGGLTPDNSVAAGLQVKAETCVHAPDPPRDVVNGDVG